MLVPLADGCFDEYKILAAAGVTNVQCIVGDWFGRLRSPSGSPSSQNPVGFSDFSGGQCYTSAPYNTSSCQPWPARDGNWSLYEDWLGYLTEHKPGPLLWYDVWK